MPAGFNLQKGMLRIQATPEFVVVATIQHSLLMPSLSESFSIFILFRLRVFFTNSCRTL
jgi:hypothetical protein